jgi:hypothetical protein
MNYRYLNTEAWKYQNGLAKFSHVPQNIQIANFGSSHGNLGFYWPEDSYTAFNFGLDGQGHDFDYALLKQYSDHFDNGAVAIFLIEFFDMNISQTNTPSILPRYYRILNTKNMPVIPKLKFVDDIRYHTLPILSAGDNILALLYDFNPEATFLEFWKYQMQSEEKILFAANTWRDAMLNSSKEYAGYLPNKEIFYTIIEYCLSHNIQPVLVTTPIASASNKTVNETDSDFFDIFYQFSSELCEKYPSVPYLDYSNDTRIVGDYSLFYDADHLNYSGAKKFTPIVIADIEKLGLLGK